MQFAYSPAPAGKPTLTWPVLPFAPFPACIFGAANDDRDENPCNFTSQGTGTLPQVNLSVEDAHTGERRAFADLTHLFAFPEEAALHNPTRLQTKEYSND